MRLNKAEGLLKSRNLEDAAAAAGEVLGDTDLLARAAFIRGKALATGLMDRVLDEEQNDPLPEEFRESYRLFKLAARLDPDYADAKEHIEKMKGIFQVLPGDYCEPNHDYPLDVIIVGAGASGVGMGLMLTRTFGFDRERVLIVERGAKPGETFRNWPEEMRFISPSFNHQGWTDSFDLNSVAFGTSPAFTLGVEHPSGEQYAKYLCELANAGKLNVMTNTEVKAVHPQDEGGFLVDVSSSVHASGTLGARFVIWAAGEFQYPKAPEPLFPGSDLCLHNSAVKSWKKLNGDDFVVIGGYESGMDACYNFASCGKRCTVIASTACWRTTTDDPSTELAPYTMERVRKALSMETPRSFSHRCECLKSSRLMAAGMLCTLAGVSQKRAKVIFIAFR